MSAFNIKELIEGGRSTLNLEQHQKILIIKAMLKARFNITEAYKLNSPSNLTLDGYRGLFRKHFPFGVKEFKKICINQLKPQ